MTTARLCLLCSNQAGDLWCWLGSGTFPKAVSATGTISPPAPLRLTDQPMHPHLGDAQGHWRAGGRAGPWAQAPAAQPALAPACSITPLTPANAPPNAPLCPASNSALPCIWAGFWQTKSSVARDPRTHHCGERGSAEIRSCSINRPVTRLLQPGCLSCSGAINHLVCRRRGVSKGGGTVRWRWPDGTDPLARRGPGESAGCGGVRCGVADRTREQQIDEGD